MTSEKFMEICADKVVEYFNKHCEKTDNAELKSESVYVIWYCKALQNHKALLSTNVTDGMYYEFTYNGDKKELYMDAYKKWENVCYSGVSEVYNTNIEKR